MLCGACNHRRRLDQGAQQSD